MLECKDKVFVRNLRVRTVIGIKPDEKANRQEVLISYELLADTSNAGSTDNIEDAVNYRTVTKRILAHAESNSFNLVEKLAEDVASICLTDTRVQKVVVTVEKPGCVRFADTAGVTICRHKKPHPG